MNYAYQGLQGYRVKTFFKRYAGQNSFTIYVLLHEKISIVAAFYRNFHSTSMPLNHAGVHKFQDLLIMYTKNVIVLHFVCQRW